MITFTHQPNFIPADVGCHNCPVGTSCESLGKMHKVDIAHGCRGNNTCKELWEKYNRNEEIDVKEIFNIITEGKYAQK